MTIKEKMNEMKNQAAINGEKAGEACAKEAIEHIENLLLVKCIDKIWVKLIAGGVQVSHTSEKATRAFYRIMDYHTLEEKNAHQTAFLKKAKEVLAVEGITFELLDTEIDRAEFFA